MIGTQHDVEFVVGEMVRFLESSISMPYSAVKRFLRYIEETLELGTCLSSSKAPNIHGFSGSDWDGDLKNRNPAAVVYF